MKRLSFLPGWRYTGPLCEGRKEESGSMWECPILLPLKPDANSSAGQPAAIIGSMDTCHARARMCSNNNQAFK